MKSSVAAPKNSGQVPAGLLICDAGGKSSSSAGPLSYMHAVPRVFHACGNRYHVCRMSAPRAREWLDVDLARCVGKALSSALALPAKKTGPTSAQYPSTKQVSRLLLGECPPDRAGMRRAPFPARGPGLTESGEGARFIANRPSYLGRFTRQEGPKVRPGAPGFPFKYLYDNDPLTVLGGFGADNHKNARAGQRECKRRNQPFRRPPP